MRNIFDYYSQAENQLTHAFFASLDQDRKLLHSFLKFLEIRAPISSSELGLTVQKYPFDSEPTFPQTSNRGIPDAWVFSGDWAIVFEVKIAAELTNSQIRRHRTTAIKRGFEDLQMVVISGKPEKLNDEL